MSVVGCTHVSVAIFGRCSLRGWSWPLYQSRRALSLGHSRESGTWAVETQPILFCLCQYFLTRMSGDRGCHKHSDIPALLPLEANVPLVSGACVAVASWITSLRLSHPR